MPNKIKVRILKKIDEKKKKDPVSDEISKLVKKGTPHKQAVAIALSMEEEGKLEEKFSKKERAKRRKKCDNPKGFTMKQFCKNQRTRSKKGERKNEEMELEERCQKGYKTHPTRKTKKMFGRTYRNCVKAEEGKDPKKGTGKKPKGSGRRLYTDENPKDTVSVEFKSVAAIKRTLAKPSFKSKSHKRQSQIINLIHQRARAAYQNAKNPKVKARLKRAFEYAEQRKEASKKKTKARLKKKKNEDVRKMPNSDRYGVYADKFKDGKRVMTPGGKHAQELKKTYANKKDANDYMAAIMIAKGG
tara:strand:+ start:870 stop:1772 length:903 start_codon:yes stop_codon:yes gene_type:complete